MRWTLFLLVSVSICVAQANPAAAQLPVDDSVRIQEFYRVASQLQDGLWPGWSKVPSPLMLVTVDTEFLTHHPSPPPELKKIGDDLFSRPRQFPVEFQATFPAFGPPSVIVIGEPSATESKRSTPWLFTVMHEHFHQLQYAQPGYYVAVKALGLDHGDTSGMWMLNYPFPYEKPEVAQAFRQLRDLLMRTLAEKEDAAFKKSAREYLDQRGKFFALVSADDRRYFSFQLWQEGIARYTEVKSAEAAAHLAASEGFAALADYEPFPSYAARARNKTLDELKQADLATWKRTVVYSFGAAEGLLLDRISPKWRDLYFTRMLSTDSYFEATR